MGVDFDFLPGKKYNEETTEERRSKNKAIIIDNCLQPWLL
jgi:hypothetical protein